MPQQTISLNMDDTSRQYRLAGSIICAIGALFYCYEFILRIIPGVLQTELSAAFGHISATAFGQLAAVYYFAYSPMQLPVGMLMDRFGPRHLLTFACFLCTIGSLLFSYSSSLMLAGFGRFLVGFGSSFAFVGVLSLAINWLPKRFFSLVAGLITTLGMLGLVYGEVKLTNMVALMGLNYVLSTLVVIGFVLTLLIFFIVRDWPQAAKRHAQPLNEFFAEVWRVLSSVDVWVIGFVGACLYTSLSVFGELWGKSYLEYAHSLTKIEAAKAISAMFLGWGVGAPIAGFISDHTGRRVLPLVLGAFLSLLCISIILYYPGLSYDSLKIWLFLYGVFSATEILVFVLAKESSSAKIAGTVLAATNMIVTLGGVIFQPLVGKLLDMVGHDNLVNGEHIYRAADYQIALSILPISLVLVILTGCFLKEHPSVE
jgi:MFS family permease